MAGTLSRKRRPPQVETIPSEGRPFTAYGAARQLWSCRDEEILIEGPAGTGKTRSILEKINFCALKYPRMRGLLVRKTRESMTESVLVTFEQEVVPAGSSLLEGPQRKLRQSYIYPNGSELVVGGLDKSMKVMSTQYDMVATFESTELAEEDAENLTTRLRNNVMPYQQLISDCNPGPPSHWLNRRASMGKMTRLLSRHEDNPVYFDQTKKDWTAKGLAYLKKLDRLSGHRYLRLRKGVWAAAEGMVYEDYDSAIHIIDWFSIPPSWKRIRTIDFGFNNPFVCQWWAVDGDGRMYLYREIYRSKRIVADHAIEINRLSQGERYEATVADHDAEDRATLEAAGIFTIPAYKDIKRGIEAVQMRLRKEEDGKPRLFIFRNALVDRDEVLVSEHQPFATEQEFDSYSYPKGIDGKPNKEEPIDKDNHGMDAMRYGAAYLDNLSGMIIRVTTAPVSAVYR